MNDITENNNLSEKFNDEKITDEKIAVEKTIDELKIEEEISFIDDTVEFYLEVDKETDDNSKNKKVVEDYKKDKKKNEIVETITTKNIPKPSKPKPVVDNTLYKSTINDGKYKILIIDDDKWIVRLFKQFLNQWGFTTISAVNPFQGLNEAIHHKPLAIFLDILIPEVAGDTLLKFLKRGDITTDIPVVLISGNLNKTIIKSTYLAGASGFLTKPITQDTLYNKVCEILDEDVYNQMISEGLLISKSSNQ